MALEPLPRLVHVRHLYGCRLAVHGHRRIAVLLHVQLHDVRRLGARRLHQRRQRQPLRARRAQQVRLGLVPAPLAVLGELLLDLPLALLQRLPLPPQPLGLRGSRRQVHPAAGGDGRPAGRRRSRARPARGRGRVAQRHQVGRPLQVPARYQHGLLAHQRRVLGAYPHLLERSAHETVGLLGTDPSIALAVQLAVGPPPQRPDGEVGERPVLHRVQRARHLVGAGRGPHRGPGLGLHRAPRHVRPPPFDQRSAGAAGAGVAGVHQQHHPAAARTGQPLHAVQRQPAVLEQVGVVGHVRAQDQPLAVARRRPVAGEVDVHRAVRTGLLAGLLKRLDHLGAGRPGEELHPRRRDPQRVDRQALERLGVPLRVGHAELQERVPLDTDHHGRVPGRLLARPQRVVDAG